MSDFILRTILDTLRFWWELLHSPLVDFLLLILILCTVGMLILGSHCGPDKDDNYSKWPPPRPEDRVR